ncbi:uncharacterized protein LOC115090736 isoform X2 [Rhinatrema bivittatum]|uniref:uncharacterized protein LOC115090736 isoform X2 n=1 Tax=Rhinatrema bivittatum TaxID=194408 RepID=UPI001125FF74|nr:uncharacterized protein LOC115090736 isoform X2 [Rhinatrema bivittatum]
MSCLKMEKDEDLLDAEEMHSEQRMHDLKAQRWRLVKTLKNDKKYLQQQMEQNVRWMSFTWKENRRKELQEVLWELQKKDYIERDCRAITNYVVEREVLMKSKIILQMETEGVQENIALLEMEIHTGFLRSPVPATESVMCEIIKAELDEEKKKREAQRRQQERQYPGYKFLDFTMMRILNCLGNTTLTLVSYMFFWLALDSCNPQDLSFWNTVLFENYLPLHTEGLKPT